MGPHPLWLLEDLLQDVDLQAGMRVLDLGCGLGMTSTFLAHEFDVDVVAADYWIDANENQERFDADGVSPRVTAVDAEAHALPFDYGEFDAIISVDSFHYFGTSDLYIGYISKFLKPGGALAVASPGAVVEPRALGGLPHHVRRLAGWEALSFHTAEWWRFHWEQSQQVVISSTRSQPEGWADWLLWCQVCAQHSGDAAVREGSQSCVAPLVEDGGAFITFMLQVARAVARP